ncbi:hypothetical protein BDV18DRAFT_135787 [Aspergillus unguis]
MSIFVLKSTLPRQLLGIHCWPYALWKLRAEHTQLLLCEKRTRPLQMVCPLRAPYSSKQYIFSLFKRLGSKGVTENAALTVPFPGSGCLINLSATPPYYAPLVRQSKQAVMGYVSFPNRARPCCLFTCQFILAS